MAIDDDTKLHEKIGFMRADIKNIGEKVSTVIDKVDDANMKLVYLTSSTVKQGECTQRIKMITDQIGTVKDLINRKQTRQDNPVITSDMLSGRDNSQVISIPIGNEEDTSRQKWVVKAKENIAFLIAVFTLVGIVIIGGIKFARFIVSVEDVVKNADRKSIKVMYDLREEINNMNRRSQKNLSVLTEPDSGVFEEPKNKNRRRH